MSKPIRKGAKTLQIRASAWVHEVIEQRTAVPGVEKWMVVERLMKAGLEAEARDRTPISVRSESHADTADNLELGENLLHNLFFRANQYLRTLFAKDVCEFMRTIREVHGGKKSLPASEWRQWAKRKQVPEEYAHTVLNVLRVLDGFCRIEDTHVSAKLAELTREFERRFREAKEGASNT